MIQLQIQNHCSNVCVCGRGGGGSYEKKFMNTITICMNLSILFCPLVKGAAIVVCAPPGSTGNVIMKTSECSCMSYEIVPSYHYIWSLAWSSVQSKIEK